jgi:hypothetical protein
VIIDPHVHRPAGRVVAEYDMPPAPVGWPAKDRLVRAGQVRGPPADAEDKDQLPRL